MAKYSTRLLLNKFPAALILSVFSKVLERPALIAAGAALATLSCIAMPRVAPLVVVSITTPFAAHLLFRTADQLGAPSWKRLLLSPMTPFVAWALIACLWSANPEAAALKALFLGVLILHAFVLAGHIDAADAQLIAAAARGILIGFLIAGSYVVLEILTDDAITRFTLTHLPWLERELVADDGAGIRHSRIREGEIVSRSISHITRATTTLCLFLAPAALAAMLYTKGIARWLCYGAIVAMLAILLFHSDTDSQTAQLAAGVALVSLAVALAAPKLARWGIGAGFASLLFLAVPASIAMFSAELHKDPDLFRSARARIIIWNYTAEQILQNPILGVGTHSSGALHEEHAKEGIETPEGFIVAPTIQSHPHNVYLEVWYELGLIGALAFALLGFSLLRYSSFLPRRSEPFALAHFAACMTILAPSYSMWQSWFQAAIALSVLALLFVAGRTVGAEGEEATA